MLSLALAALLIIITVKVSKLVWSNDKIIPTMLILLTASLFSLALYYILLIVAFNRPEWACGTSRSSFCSGYVLTELPAYFLALAGLMNINKWIYFLMRTRAFIRVGFGSKPVYIRPRPPPNSME